MTKELSLPLLLLLLYHVDSIMALGVGVGVIHNQHC